MSFDYPARVKAGIILTTLLALYTSLHLLSTWAQFDLSFVGQDEISLYEKRFEEIKGKLPERGVVGYKNNRNFLNHLDSANPSGLREWFLTQYSLAPLIISPTPGHKLIVVNEPDDNAGGDSAGQDLTISDYGKSNKVLDFGNGVKLEKREF